MREHEAQSEEEDAGGECRQMCPGRGQDEIGRRGRTQAEGDQPRTADALRKPTGHPAAGDHADAEHRHEQPDAEGVEAERRCRIRPGVAERTEDQEPLGEHDEVGAQGRRGVRPTAGAQYSTTRWWGSPCSSTCPREARVREDDGDGGGDDGVGEEHAAPTGQRRWSPRWSPTWPGPG